MQKTIELVDYEPSTDSSLEEIMSGLGRKQKELPCKLFYDEDGSDLYEQITQLEAYYPTRVESAIMRSNVSEIASLIGPHSAIIEYGSGSSEKTRILLRALDSPTVYIPIDISKEHLLRAAGDIADEFPELDVLPVCADYHENLKLPEPDSHVQKKIVYFPGSTIGNFHRYEARDFLSRMRQILDEEDGVLIGVDLEKDVSVLELAYDDPEGVTAAFNLNILRRLNREFGAEFQLDNFTHRSLYNKEHCRIEMHLVSNLDQTVVLDGTSIELTQGETIWTESSYKYTPDSFEKLTREAGFEVERVWTDPDQFFSVQFLQPSL